MPLQGANPTPSFGGFGFRLGVRLPGNSPNSSSRGGKPRPTGGAHHIAPLQVNALIVVGGQTPGTLTPTLQTVVTPATAEPFILWVTTHFGRFTGQCNVLE